MFSNLLFDLPDPQPELAKIPTPAEAKELKSMLGTNAEPVHVFHRFWEKAIPQYEVGYGKIRSKLDALETSHPGLHFTGNYRGGISVADTILHALKLTDLLTGTSN